MSERPLLRRIVGTAGHIDHGKSSLVRSLTGTDPDRLPEEKRRGITIDLGFANLVHEDVQIGFVDVPGHERFVRNMLAGAGGIDCVILVVAADESIMPQTREHFDICRMLGIREGLVAITKADLVDAEMIELVRLETADLVAGSFLEGKPMIPVSAVSGEGLDDLRDALVQMVRRSGDRQVRGRSARLPVDRVFSVKGFGTVVTGTLLSGEIRKDAELELLPGGTRVRARGVEVHGGQREIASAGERTSVNVTDVEVDQVDRGLVLAPAGAFRASNLLTVELTLLDSSPELKNGARVHLHLHSAETLATVRLVGSSEKIIAAGQTVLAQLRTEGPIVAAADDRFVIRRYSPVITIGGGRVLDPHATRLPASTNADVLAPLVESDIAGRTRWWARRAGIRGLSREDVAQRTGVASTAVEPLVDPALIRVRDGGPWLHPDTLQGVRRNAMTLLESFLRENRMSVGMPKQTFLQKLMPRGIDASILAWVLADLERERIAAVSGDVVDVPGRKKELAGVEGELAKRVEKVYQEAGLQPPLLGELVRAVSQKGKIVEGMLAYLTRLGVLVRLADGLFVHRDAIAGVRERLAPHKGESIDIAWFKELLGLSRKVAIPLLEHLDSTGVTRRVGDKREVN